jgi:dTDP-4-dehydrorhamnose reductase
MKIMLIGASGQLGTDLQKASAAQPAISIRPLTHADIEVRDHEQTRRIITQYAPDVVLNTSAYHQVDLCEDTPNDAWAVNALAVRNMAQICREQGRTLLHISTDYVFDGLERTTAYSEADATGPLSVYAVSKDAGEHFLRALAPQHFLVRTTGLYGVAPLVNGRGGNFIETMLRLANAGRSIKVVADQVLTPTYTLDLAHKLLQLVQTDAYGTYHITSAGQVSWYDFAAAAFERAGLSPDFEPTTSAAFGAKARRPAYSVLDNANLRQLGLDDLRPWQQALDAYFAERATLTA